MRSSVTALVGLVGTANGFALTPDLLSRPSSVVRSASQIQMNWVNTEDMVSSAPVWGDPREGKPFGDADRDEAKYVGTSDSGSFDVRKKIGGVRTAEASKQPRGITDATVVKPQYIETEDEPWHATCRPASVITKGDLESSLEAGLPFIAPETKLGDDTRAAKDGKAMKASIDAALKAGARPGSPAIKAAEKVLKAFEGGDKDAAEKAKPKAPKADGGGKGWDVTRGLAKVHDNSVA